MTGLAAFHFLRPAWLLLLLALPLLAWLWRRQQARANPWRRVVDAHLLPALLEQPAAARASARPLWLALAVLLIATLALAGPAWRLEPQPVLRSERGLVIALDLSERMLAADLAPDRLSRARFKIAELLRHHRDGQIALVAYAGDAFTVAPLTTDAQTLEALLAALAPEVMPEPGQAADRAIRLAARLARDAGLPRAELLLLTDRADAAAVAAADAARAGGLRTSVLAVGTEHGAPIPLAQGGFAVDAAGRPRLAAVELDGLQALARAGGGRLAMLAGDDSDLRALGVLGPTRDAGVVDDPIGTLAVYRDEGRWLLLLLLPLAAAGFRRGWLACLPLLAVLAPAPAQAFDWAALWQRDEQRAHRALEAGDPTPALQSRDPMRRGAALFRHGEHAAAAQTFALIDDAGGHYNRGNALAHAGELEQALAAYDTALERDPAHADARHNRGIVQHLLEQQQAASSPSGGAPEPGDGAPDEDAGTPDDADRDAQAQAGDAGDDAGERREEEDVDGPGHEADGEGRDEADADPTEPDAEQQQALADEIDAALDAGADSSASDGDAVMPFAEAADDAGEEAIDQALRRVADDPGGLLRRKFALEHRRRQLEGRPDE